ncbi:hypothetical protein [Planctomicrobium sp. SH664]|uniref:hypothetical protein n=1 Tax=Planctomicrobium sp. SH664 TaxID=3448125 RepID=UPI003F5BFB0B
MTAQFAGARNADDRRRRRLVQESGNSHSPVVESEAGFSPADSPETRSPAVVLKDESVIPRAGWKLAVAIVLCLSAWGGIVWAGVSNLFREQGLQHLSSLRDGKFIHYFSTVALIVSAELCFLILWYRARSRKDFMGRYRIWGWAGLFWGVVSFAQATEIHVPLAQMAFARWPVQCYRPETLYWLVPFATCFLAMHRVLATEMRQSSLSETCWNLMLLLGVGFLSLQLGAENSLPIEFREPVIAGVTTLFHLSITVALLVHARYVVHVSNEVGPRKSSLPIRLYRRLKNVLFGKKRVDESAAAAPAKTSRKAKAADVKTDTAEEASETPPAKAKPVPARAVAEEDATAVEAETTARSEKKRVLGQSVRVDPPQAKTPAPHASPVEKPKAEKRPAKPSFDDFDDEDFDDDIPLNRRERKRLKKLQRSEDY